MKKLTALLGLTLALAACAPAAPTTPDDKPMAKRAAMEWKAKDAGTDNEGIPKTELNLMTAVSETPLFTTVCSGTASLESAQDMEDSVADAQCWWAGGGMQYGVFIGDAEKATVRQRTVDEEAGYGQWEDVKAL